MADLTSKEFLDELERAAALLRRDIEAKARQMDPSPAAITARRKRVLGGDFEYFVYTYFPHHMWLEPGAQPSDFQQQFMQWVPKALALATGWKH
jgi:hypothetical protein